jgi:hypothetical protein
MCDPYLSLSNPPSDPNAWCCWVFYIANPATDIKQFWLFFKSLSSIILSWENQTYWSPNCSVCQQLKRTGARSAGSSAACNDFIPAACLCNMMTWGGEPGTLIWMWEERWWPQAMWRGSGRRMTSCWDWTAHQKGRPFIFYSSSPGPGTSMWRELKTGL